MKQRIAVYVVVLLFVGMLYLKRDTPKVQSLISYIKGFKSSDDTIQISLHQSGEIVVSGKTVSLDQMIEEIHQLQSTYYQATHEVPKVLLVIDKNAQMGMVRDVDKKLQEGNIIDYERAVR